MDTLFDDISHKRDVAFVYPLVPKFFFLQKHVPEFFFQIFLLGGLISSRYLNPNMVTIDNVCDSVVH